MFIVFVDIGGVDWCNVVGIGWVVGGLMFEFVFEFDNIEFE